jgi:hypothetical protein
MDDTLMSIRPVFIYLYFQIDDTPETVVEKPPVALAKVVESKPDVNTEEVDHSSVRCFLAFCCLLSLCSSMYVSHRRPLQNNRGGRKTFARTTCRGVADGNVVLAHIRRSSKTTLRTPINLHLLRLVVTVSHENNRGGRKRFARTICGGIADLDHVVLAHTRRLSKTALLTRINLHLLRLVITISHKNNLR